MRIEEKQLRRLLGDYAASITAGNQTTKKRWENGSRDVLTRAWKFDLGGFNRREVEKVGGFFPP